MPMLFLSRLSHELAESNRRISHWVEAEDADVLRHRGARAARELTRFTLSRRTDAQGVLEGAVEVLKDGVASEESREILQIVQEVVDSWLTLAETTRGLWDDVTAATGAAPEGMDELDAAEKAVKEVKATVEKMHAFLARSRPPIDPVLLRKGREEVEQGRFKTPEEMRSHLDGPRA